MKKRLLTIFLISNICIVYGQKLDKKYLHIVNDFIAAVKNEKIEKLSTKISYPLERAYPIPAIENRQEFIRRYKEVFDDDLVKKILSSKPSTDWDAVGWRGIMLLNGELWLDYDGKLSSVNHQSNFEAKEKARLIALEKTELHPSIKKFEQPVIILETSKYRIRIDDLGNNNYRYASWPIKSKMNGKPKLVLTNGKWIPDGSGGNHHYEFKSGNYLYTCFIWIMSDDDTPPAQLEISLRGTEILSQPAKIIIPKI